VSDYGWLPIPPSHLALYDEWQSLLGQPLDERPLLVENVKTEQVKGRSFYFLWALERMAVALNLDTISKKDWYAWGAESLLQSQQADGSWQGDYGACGADTCFALLFLKRANLTSGIAGEVKHDSNGAEVIPEHVRDVIPAVH
jgi:hypothetical protein